jgi:hypothetical protein
VSGKVGYWRFSLSMTLYKLLEAAPSISLVAATAPIFPGNTRPLSLSKTASNELRSNLTEFVG